MHPPFLHYYPQYICVLSSMMVILNCHSTPKPQTLSSSSPLHPNIINKKSELVKVVDQQEKLMKSKKVQQQQQRPPSVVEIERAIGAGIFRDRDVNSETSDKGESIFDSILRNSVGKSEGDAERKLRETGEWLVDQTENTSNSAGKNILMTMFVWVLPVWVFAFLLASGVVQLPFHNTFMEDLFA